MNKDDILSSLILELRRGTIVLSVLSQLNKPTYGYNLVNILAEKGVNIEANTLYPLLRRLEGQGLLESTWETSGTKPRKYYAKTEKGNEISSALKEHWDSMVRSIDKLLEGDVNEK
ncbi:PadR family transcriptional regulator [Tissierella sp. Yu-01]|uniref:PadR family transcriptional regulator n=1 Tax=Tissierella sp. Yu-01 TaxID=3035694 RepID=UPI00240E09CB|nr:PadR family transcriptional regulator [Tissierella sp. Yu-01]WFA09336.1 PadR family transcriptional regulator [Tissierella sp. Yu-01]